ncbi:restriction endonuclease subunit S [Pseudomonas peradeniyensis]|uniref:restriction endonuclease subunit S n=1 Tax=Pseudomonas TaxID=286 RepID=UPI000A9BD7A7|nr:MULTISPECIES: restriction endonuclease subunit S [Pseudomonas]MCU7282060.1 restriction endonuclease subunit S [Pseudomonas peradeniyensis]
MSFKTADVGIVPEAWDVEELRYFLDLITYGFTNPMPDSDEGPWKLTAKDIVNGRINYGTARRTTIEAFKRKLTDKSRPRVGDVLLTKDGSIGRVAVVDRDGVCINQSVALLRPKKNINPEFLKYLLISPHYQRVMENDSDGSTIKHIYITRVDKMQVAVPPLAEQSEILKVVGTIDDRITLLRETNATLEAIAQALFKSWFVDFDPVRAKAEGRQPEGMDATTAALFPNSFEDSELGLVPKGWAVGSLGVIAQIVRRQIQASELHAGVRYVGLEHIPRKSLSLSSWGNADGLESTKSAFSEGDILFGKLRPYFHKVVLAPFSGVCSTDILVCQPKEREYFGVVAMHLFSETLISYADRLSNGAKMPRVNWKDLAEYPIVVPSSDIAAKLNEAIHPLLARMTDGIHRAHTLTQLRDTLLPRLISGQLRLPEAEVLI